MTASTSGTQERTYYAPILESLPADMAGFPPELFRPCVGTVLCVRPPIQTKTPGGVELTQKSWKEGDVVRVAAVPNVVDEDHPRCPVSPGDWAVIRHLEGGKVTFGGRKDLIVVNYFPDARSDILGFFRDEDVASFVPCGV